jgi:hypothetical protein
MDIFPDLGALSDQELKELIEHEEGEPIITGADGRQLTEILGGRDETDRTPEE